MSKPPPAAMIDEVTAAAHFIANLPQPSTVESEARERFRRALTTLMINKFRDHWNVDHPMRGNGFRSIMTCGWLVDPMLKAAANAAGMSSIEGLFPSDFVIWIDPHDVSYRIGEFGGVCQLYERSMRSDAIPDSTPVASGIAVSVN